MQHLIPDELARLVDEPMTAQEMAHVSRCRQCMTAIEEMRLQTMALGALPQVAPPPRAWGAIERRVSSSPAIRLRRAWWPERRNRFAAAAMWMLIGAGIQAALVALMFASSGNQPSATVASPITLGTPPERGAPVLSEHDAALAIERVAAAEEKLYSAIFEASTNQSISVERSVAARLAMYDAMLATTGAALEHAPADPVINGYHLTVLAQRDALLRQLSREPGDGGERN